MGVQEFRGPDGRIQQVIEISSGDEDEDVDIMDDGDDAERTPPVVAAGLSREAATGVDDLVNRRREQQTATIGGRIRQVIEISSGDEDEDVDIIDDGDDADRTPPVVAAGVSRDATGVDDPVNRRREQHRTASIGGRSEPQLVAREHGSSKHPDVYVPEVALEGTSSKQRQISAKSSAQVAVNMQQQQLPEVALEGTSSKRRDFQKQMSAIGSSGQLAVMQQQQSKRKASETEPSTSALMKGKQILQDGEGEPGTRGKSPPVTVRPKRTVIVLDDDSDEELLERSNDGVRNPETSSIGPIRSAFPLKAKRGEHPRHSEAAGLAATHKADKQSIQHWRRVTCTKCKKIRSVSADEEVDTSSWCCEMNTRNPKYASCSAPHHEIQQPRNRPSAVEIERKKRAQRKMMREDMVWAKVQVNGKPVWWPGLRTKVLRQVPAEFQKIIDEERARDNTCTAVQLFHPPKGLTPYRIVRQSSLKPFSLRALRNNRSRPDFIVAVTEADKYVTDLA